MQQFKEKETQNRNAATFPTQHWLTTKENGRKSAVDQ